MVCTQILVHRWELNMDFSWILLWSFCPSMSVIRLFFNKSYFSARLAREIGLQVWYNYTWFKGAAHTAASIKQLWLEERNFFIRNLNSLFLEQTLKILTWISLFQTFPILLMIEVYSSLFYMLIQNPCLLLQLYQV